MFQYSIVFFTFQYYIVFFTFQYSIVFFTFQYSIVFFTFQYSIVFTYFPKNTMSKSYHAVRSILSVNYYYYYFTSNEFFFFTTTSIGSLSQTFQRQQVYSSLKDSSEYSSHHLDGLYSSSDFQFLQSAFLAFWDRSKCTNYNWYRYPHIPLIFDFSGKIWLFGLVSLFNGISTFVGHLMPKPFS